MFPLTNQFFYLITHNENHTVIISSILGLYCVGVHSFLFICLPEGTRLVLGLVNHSGTICLVSRKAF